MENLIEISNQVISSDNFEMLSIMIFITSRFRVISVVGLIAVIFYDLNYDKLLILMLKFSIIGRRCRRRRSVAVRLKIHLVLYLLVLSAYSWYGKARAIWVHMCSRTSTVRRYSTHRFSL